MLSKQSNQRYRKEKDGEQKKAGEDKTYTADKSSQGQDKLEHDFTSPTDCTKSE